MGKRWYVFGFVRSDGSTAPLLLDLDAIIGATPSTDRKAHVVLWTNTQSHPFLAKISMEDLAIILTQGTAKMSAEALNDWIARQEGGEK